MKRKLIPPNSSDQIAIITGLIGTIVCSLLYLYEEGDELLDIVFLIVSLVLITGTYIFQTPRKIPQKNRYSKMIELLSRTSGSLNELKDFLEQEKKNINEMEQTVSKLTKKQEELQPVVEADENTVRAILSAHTKTQRTNIWKERILVFILGVMSSIIGSYLISKLVNEGG